MPRLPIRPIVVRRQCFCIRPSPHSFGYEIVSQICIRPRGR